MKNVKRWRLIVSTVTVGWLMLMGLNVRAQSAAPPTPPTPPGSTATANLLSQAYATLAVADHDYQGHRVRAMKHIEVAAKVLGVTLQGKGSGHEPQAASDQQLRTAQSLLQQALVPGLKPRVQNQINLALSELGTALSIK